MTGISTTDCNTPSVLPLFRTIIILRTSIPSPTRIYVLLYFYPLLIRLSSLYIPTLSCTYTPSPHTSTLSPYIYPPPYTYSFCFSIHLASSLSYIYPSSYNHPPFVQLPSLLHLPSSCTTTLPHTAKHSCHAVFCRSTADLCTIKGNGQIFGLISVFYR